MSNSYDIAFDISTSKDIRKESLGFRVIVRTIYIVTKVLFQKKMIKNMIKREIEIIS